MQLMNLSNGATMEALERLLADLAGNPQVHGIMLSLPLAPQLAAEKALELIPWQKDVDGLGPVNLGRITAGREQEAILSATPQSCLMLAESVVDLAGKRAVVVGRGKTVGRILIPMLINRDATVTVCHSKTRDLEQVIREHDVVFVAIGHGRFIKPRHLRRGQVVIDAGINVQADGICGDVDSDAVVDLVQWITPVPGGVGPLTSALLYQNLMHAMDLQFND